MKKGFAVILAIALLLTSVAAMAVTTTIGGETVVFKDGVLTTYGEITFNEVLLDECHYRGVDYNMPAKEAGPIIIADLDRQVEEKIVKEYTLENMDNEGNINGVPLDIDYEGKPAQLIVVSIVVTYEDGKVCTERWNFIKFEGDDDYKVLACYIENI